MPRSLPFTAYIVKQLVLAELSRVPAGSTPIPDPGAIPVGGEHGTEQRIRVQKLMGNGSPTTTAGYRRDAQAKRWAVAGLQVPYEWEFR